MAFTKPKLDKPFARWGQKATDLIWQLLILMQAVSPIYTKLQSCHCEERSDVAIYHIEIASHSFAMTPINSSRLNATWY